MEKETLEEASERIFNIPEEKKGDVYFGSNIAYLRKGFIFGAKWQAERMYSEALEFGRWIIQNPDFQNTSSWSLETAKFNFEQFKKKA